MVSPIERARQEPPEKRRQIALIISVIIAGIIFLVWISTFSSKFGEVAEDVEVEKGYEPTFVEKAKRKIDLLVSGLEFPQIGSPVEYKQPEIVPEEPTILEKTGIATSTKDESFDDIIESMFAEEFDEKVEENIEEIGENLE